MIASNKTFPDTTLLNSYNKMAFGNIFVYNKGGYEGLKSVGLNKLSNDSLRRELILIYEVDLPGIESFYQLLVDEASRNKDYKLQLHNALWKRVQMQMPDTSYKIVSKTINNEEFLKQSELLDRIKIEQDNLNFISFRMPHLEIIIKRGLDLINKELGHQDE